MKISRDEALRYLGAAGAGEDTRRAVEAVAGEIEGSFQPQFIYRVFDCAVSPEGVCLPQANLCLPGKMAQRMLSGCHRAALLCCTLGLAFDRLLLKTQSRDMARAVIMDVCGSAYVEAGCDEAEKEIAARYPDLFLTDRFSPGYGDLPLSVQANVLQALDAQRLLGVYALPSFMMAPAKSVTAVIGLSRTPQPARVRGCGYCAMKENCVYRKGGTTCGF